jgi:hypothetical protein
LPELIVNAEPIRESNVVTPDESEIAVSVLVAALQTPATISDTNEPKEDRVLVVAPHTAAALSDAEGGAV